MQIDAKERKIRIGLFMVVISLMSIGLGLSDSVFSNYFKDAYNITAFQRGFIEFPRELPGLLCAVAVAALSFLGDFKSALIAQALSIIGLLALGLITPAFGVMLIFLFINSLGMHLMMPLQDSIGMSLAEPGQVGKRVGQFASVRSAFGFVAAILVFFGFRFGWFSFTTRIKWIFIIGVAAFVAAFVVMLLLCARVKQPMTQRKKLSFVFRKEYKYYYLLTILHGVQKQIAYVYGSWVIIDLLMKKADTMAVLTLASSFACIFFMNLLGKWIDKLGIKKMMYFDALTFIGVYIVYGFMVLGITNGTLPMEGWVPIGIYVLFVLDRLSMQIGVVKSVYLRSIALSDSDVTATLSVGTSFDHVVSIIAAFLGGIIWEAWGGAWVFFFAAAFSIGNLVIAMRVQPEKERAHALAIREKQANIGA